MAEKEHHSKDGSRWTPVIVAVISAALGSGSGIAVYLRTPIAQEIARPDPFTGSQAAALSRQIDAVKADVIDHRIHHPDRELDSRLSVLEAHYEDILRHLERIEKKVEK